MGHFDRSDQPCPPVHVPIKGGPLGLAGYLLSICYGRIAPWH